MTESTLVDTHADDQMLPEIGARLNVQKMPAHWLMARLGKRVLRPGGLEMTRWLLERARISAEDDVIEFAPGLGRTAMLILSQGPRTYAGVERDEQAARSAEGALADAGFAAARVVRGNAASVPLARESATVVIGEAMLSMQTLANKCAIMAEACRLLRPGGRYLIHELAITPETLDPVEISRIQKDLSAVIHVGVRIGTVGDWTDWLEEAGFTVEQTTTVPMRLLEPGRMVRDEGVGGMLRFVWNAVRTPGAARRLRVIRGVFSANRHHLCAVGVIARRNQADRT